MQMQSIETADEVYQAFRSNTRAGLEIGSLVVGGYEAVRGVMALNRLLRGSAQASHVMGSLVGEGMKRSKQNPIHKIPQLEGK